MTRLVRRTDGFTLLEMLVVVTLICITSGTAASLMHEWIPIARANGAMRTIEAQLIAAREIALTQRRNIEVTLLPTNEIRLTRREIPAGTTVLRTVPLEHSVSFMLFQSVPDTPDGFGNANAVDFGAAASLIFTSDGTFIDEQGVPLNGTVFLGLPSHPLSARGITVFGGTGRVRGYRWDGVRWGS